MSALMEIQNRLPCAWDEFDVYLFDIDGTLLTCTDAIHYFAFCHALKMLSGLELSLEGVVTHGNVDAGILRDALTRAGLDERQWRPKLREAQAAMCEFVHERREHICIETLPSVEKILKHLHCKGAKLAVATGNLERIGQLKLERAGLWEYFDFGGWSDMYESRAEVFGGAIARAKELYGEAVTVCVLGDTPFDIQAAHSNDAPVIAVATGIYSSEELSRAQPEMLLRSFEELFA